MRDIFQKLNDRGITIIMVTHEPDIASYAQRDIVMRDGSVQSDRAVAQRLVAAAELGKIATVNDLVPAEA